jgi:hypothetical protein
MSLSSFAVADNYNNHNYNNKMMNAVTMPSKPLLRLGNNKETATTTNKKQQQHQQYRRSMFTLPAQPGEEQEDDINSNDYNTTTDDDDVLFFDYYESPCLVKASNDEFTFLDFQNFRTLCNETFYGGCLYENKSQIIQQVEEDDESSSASPSIVEWTITYDYEVYYPRNETDPIPSIQHLETIMLEHLSEIIGLQNHNCTDDDDDHDNNNIDEKTVTTPRAGVDSGSRSGGGRLVDYFGERRRISTNEYLHDFTDEMLQIMLAISSEPSDMIDPEFGT